MHIIKRQIDKDTVRFYLHVKIKILLSKTTKQKKIKENRVNSYISYIYVLK